MVEPSSLCRAVGARLYLRACTLHGIDIGPNQLGGMMLVHSHYGKLMSLHLQGSRLRHRAACMQQLKSWQGRDARTELSARKQCEPCAGTATQGQVDDGTHDM